MNIPSVSSPYRPFSFLTPTETGDLKATIQSALNALGKKHLGLIVHGPSFPSVPSEDTGIGSPVGEGARRLLAFLDVLGFNCLQLGPGGKTKSVDASPYISTTFSANPLFIDLSALVDEGLLSQPAYRQIVENAPACPPDNGDVHRMAYPYVFERQAQALEEAWQTFKLKQAEDDPKTVALAADFERFKAENNEWLENDALYEALSEIHGNDYWPLWPGDLDKQLKNPRSDEERAAAAERIAQLRRDHGDRLDAYAFSQFLIHRQRETVNRLAEEKNIKLIADRQVGFSDRDTWAYRSLFLDDYLLGAPPDHFSRSGQAWGFNVLDPALVFDPETGELGPAGRLLEKLYDMTFEKNPGGVRIDHIIGLIDPWVYRRGKQPVPEEGAARLHSSPEHGELSKYSRVPNENIDHNVGPADEKRVVNLTDAQVERYCEILKLIASSARRKGLTDDAIICEDLGSLTNPVIAAMNKMQLSGLRITQFVDPGDPHHLYRGKNVEPRHWIMTGSHDNMPLAFWVEERFAQHQAKAHARYLSEDLIPADRPAEDRERFFGHLAQDPRAFMAAKFAELFASPAENIQIFFPDLFGIRAYYNRPSTSGQDNWSLRIPNGFETYYLRRVAENEALNIPAALKTAIESLGSQKVTAHTGLLARLEHWANRLREAGQEAGGQA